MEEASELTYNYIIIGSDGYYSIGYRDIMNLNNVKYFFTYTDGVEENWLKKAIRFNFSRKINKIIPTPLSKLVYPHIYKHKFNNNKPICFLFFGNREYIYQTSYINYLQRKYPNAKLVLYMQDLISRNKKLDFDKTRHVFDQILSYDKGDCEKYNLHFHPTPMSNVEFGNDQICERYDVYFCGFAKTRYPIINNLYKKLTSQGLKCDFHLMNYPDNEDKVAGIHYNEAPFSYEKNIQHVLNSRCILEIMQENADGFTPRVWESIIYDRHLLTNNRSLFNSEFFNEKNMHFVESNDIMSWINESAEYSFKEKNRLSPIHLLYFIDNLLRTK